MSVPEKIINKKLYSEIKEEIKEEYPKNSAYRSALIIKRYKEAGGKIKRGYESNLDRWFEEEWINVYSYLKENKIVKCGDKNYTKKSACRPLKRVSPETPTTLPELLEIYTKKEILAAVNKKNKDPQNTILRWDTLSVYTKSKK